MCESITSAVATTLITDWLRRRIHRALDGIRTCRFPYMRVHRVLSDLTSVGISNLRVGRMLSGLLNRKALSKESYYVRTAHAQ